MKKVLKIALTSLVCVFGLISSFGCSCSKTVKVQYTVNVVNANESDTKVANFAMRAIVNKKFREPADTPCYEKITTAYTFNENYSEITYSNNKKIFVTDNSFTIKNTTFTINNERNKLIYDNNKSVEVKDRKFNLVSYELMANSTGVSQCYNSIGQKFEKATVDKVEKVELEKKFPLIKDSGSTHYESSLKEAPKEENYSLIYEFLIENYSFDETVYIKEFDIDTIIGDQLKENSTLKISYNVEYYELVILDNERYYKLEANETVAPNQTSNLLTLTVQVKGLTKNDLAKGVENLNLNIKLVTKFN